MIPGIKGASAQLMVITAFLVDLLQVGLGLFHFLPLVGNALTILLTTLVSIGAFLMFFIWLKIEGVTFIEKLAGGQARKMVVAYIILPAVEMIPVLKIITPGWTIGVYLSLLTHQSLKKMLSEEDRLRLNRIVKIAKRKGVRSPRFYREIDELFHDKADIDMDIKENVDKVEAFVAEHPDLRQRRQSLRTHTPPAK